MDNNLKVCCSRKVFAVKLCCVQRCPLFLAGFDILLLILLITFYFQAYAAGCDIVILACDFQRVQIIPGVTHGNLKVNCIDCSTDSGKVCIKLFVQRNPLDQPFVRNTQDLD